MGNIHLGKARNCSNVSEWGYFKSPLLFMNKKNVGQEEMMPIIGKGIHYLGVQLLNQNS